MDPATIANIFGKVPSTGTNIFHEIAAEGSIILLERVSQFIMPSNRFLLQERNYSGQECVHIVAYLHKGHLAIDLMKMLLNLGGNINAKNRTGESVLHQAVYCENYELVKWMCEQPPLELNVTNRSGLTAYQIAFDRNDKKMMSILRSFGANAKIFKVYSSDESD